MPFQAMDFPSQSLYCRTYDSFLSFLHAFEEDPGALERVSLWQHHH
jgi:hypothetical protein